MKTKKQIDAFPASEMHAHFIQVPDYIWKTFKLAIETRGGKNMREEINKVIKLYCESVLIFNGKGLIFWNGIREKKFWQGRLKKYVK